LGDEARDVKLVDQVVEIVVRLQNHAAAAPAIAAAGAALGNVGFAMERDRAFAAVTGAGENFDFVNEHGLALTLDLFLNRNQFRGRAKGEPGRPREIKKARRVASPEI
jgi:hypothetical protein